MMIDGHWGEKNFLSIGGIFFLSFSLGNYSPLGGVPLFL